ncbi:hypothetical protein EJB05_33737, partial [Eragrostis curvula]
MALSDRLPTDADNFVPKGSDANDCCASQQWRLKSRLLVGLPEGYCRLKTTTFYNPKRDAF